MPPDAYDAQTLEAELAYISFKTARRLNLPLAGITAYYGPRSIEFEARYQQELEMGEALR